MAQREIRSAPINPDSLLWKYGADSRIHLLRGYTGVIQNMLPAIGQALLDHSKFFDEPFARLERSTPQIIASIYSPEDSDLQKRIRDYHVDIAGTDNRGQKYHALNAETYWWAHATFVERVIRTQDFFGTPFTPEERDQIVREGVTWWRRYGMSDRPVIDNYADLVAYIKHMEETELQRNATVDFALRTAKAEKVKAPEGMSEKTWNVIWKPVMGSLIWLTIGTLSERQREILEVTWTAKDQKRFERFCALVRRVHPRLPENKRFMEPGYSMMKEQGAVPAVQS